MGNTPSKEPQGRSFHRLSKPRVASHQGTPPLLSPNGQLNTSNRSSDPGPDLFSIPYSSTATSTLSIDLDRNDLDDGEKRNSFLAPPKPQRRRSLFRSKSSQEPSERRRSRRNTVVGSPVPPEEPPAVSRANSVNANNLGADQDVRGCLASPDIGAAGGSRASWAYDFSSYEAQRLLSLVPEQLPALPRSNTLTSLRQPNLDAMRRPARRRDSLPVQPTSSPMSRSNSEVSLHPPMRRRSMVQTPGVATRSVRPAPVITRTSYRHSLPATPNMSRQASFEGPDYRVVSLPPLPPIPTPFRVTEDIPRVVTPTEGAYSTTGGFKFGTLRIINGDPDLTPDVPESYRAQVDGSKPLTVSMDYFTNPSPREGGDTTDPKMRHTQIVGVASGNVDKSAAPANPEPLARHDANAPTLPVDVPSSKIEISTPLDLLSDPVEPRCKAEVSPVLVTQSKHTAAEDQLFEADDESEAEMPTAEVLDVRVDPSARRLPSQCQDASSQGGVQAIERSDSGFVSNAVSDSSKSHSSLTKADSGYSSSVSLRSFRSERKPLTNENDAARSPVGRAREATTTQVLESRQVMEHTNSVVIGDNSDDERAPTPPPKDTVVVRPVKSTAVENGRADSNRKGKKAARQELPPINVNRAEGHHTRKSESMPPTPASAKSDASESASSLSIGSTAQKHGRLHRFLSLRGSAHSKAPLTVHVTHAVDGEVPAIPKDVEKKLREHTGRFPMSAKRLALKSQLSQETLKTILSVGSLEISKEDELPPTPTFFDDSDESMEEYDATASRDGRDNSIRQTITSMQSNFKQAAASMMPHKKPTAAKVISASSVHSPTRRHAPAANTTFEEGAQFGQISASTSLGSHPFIVAEAGLDPKSEPRNWSGRSMTMTSTQESRQPLRTYSLNTTRSDYSSPLSWPLSPTNPPSRASSPSKRLRSPPPVSMATRTLHRPAPPPPRSAARPQFPEGLAGRGYEAGRLPQTSLSAAPRAPALNAQRSLDSVRRAGSVPGTLQYRTSDWDPHTRQNSLSIRDPALDLGRHSSLPAYDDVSRSQAYANNAAVRRQSSNDGFSRNRTQGHPYGPEHGASNGWSKPPSVHRRNFSTGSGPQHSMGNPPYRILHSYNSPAYRNAPIWG
ncbi:hypothetical protein KVR01_002156 [Diaporthe batatas]|uniref:uncharacterized protein n=1 Tax=Diaporthe batatas TaxID=748121 RepID=UPI001D046834|nr:uncharacterized protein KVR01_002156 [Diaporthe batatas]KAG8166467.1 hypothetical protein KVR01_002156 [Diaporthe batatas]